MVPLIEWQIKPQSDPLSFAPASWRIINEPYWTFHIFGATRILDRAHEIATGLRDLVQSVRLLGAEVVIVGIRAQKIGGESRLPNVFTMQAICGEDHDPLLLCVFDQ